MIITGIGSRRTPAGICAIIEETAYELAKRGHVIRSGGAVGADQAFETGARRWPGSRLQIYLPWVGFNDYPDAPSNSFGVAADALVIACGVHPKWSGLNKRAKLLHGRNVYQILGRDLRTPSDLVIAWTERGEDLGGTRTALVLGRQAGIPILNIGGLETVSVAELLERSNAMTGGGI